MEIKSFLEYHQFMNQVSALKKLKRVGWIQRGIKEPESVAEHSFRMAIMALTLGNKQKLGIDIGKAIKMSLVHDLAESVIGDITPAHNISKEEKFTLEEAAFKQVVINIEGGEELYNLWKEFEEENTIEAKFVKSLDQLELLFQAYEYELAQPEVNLDEFWIKRKDFNFGNLQEMYEELIKIRNK